MSRAVVVSARGRRGELGSSGGRASSSRRRTVRAGVREGAAGLSGVQRARMLSAAVRVVSERGYAGMTVARVAGGARVSRCTFYEVFADREDCFLAVFEDALARVSARMCGAYGDARGEWCERVRAGLQELLMFCEEEPWLASVLVVDALGAGPRVLECRAQALARLGRVLHQGGLAARGSADGKLPVLTGEGVVGAVFGVIHSRVSQPREGSGGGLVLDLLGPLMGIIVLPYLGATAAGCEQRKGEALSRDRQQGSRTGAKSSTRPVEPPVGMGDPLEGLEMRLTYRTSRVLEAVAEHPGASNRAVGDRAGTHDQGQISKLLARLEGLGLIENASSEGRRHTGEPNAWRLTARGQEIERAVRVRATPQHNTQEQNR